MDVVPPIRTAKSGRRGSSTATILRRFSKSGSQAFFSRSGSVLAQGYLTPMVLDLLTPRLARFDPGIAESPRESADDGAALPGVEVFGIDLGPPVAEAEELRAARGQEDQVRPALAGMEIGKRLRLELGEAAARDDGHFHDAQEVAQELTDLGAERGLALRARPG